MAASALLGPADQLFADLDRELAVRQLQRRRRLREKLRAIYGEHSWRQRAAGTPDCPRRAGRRRCLWNGEGALHATPEQAIRAIREHLEWTGVAARAIMERVAALPDESRLLLLDSLVCLTGYAGELRVCFAARDDLLPSASLALVVWHLAIGSHDDDLRVVSRARRELIDSFFVRDELLLRRVASAALPALAANDAEAEMAAAILAALWLPAQFDAHAAVVALMPSMQVPLGLQTALAVVELVVVLATLSSLSRDEHVWEQRWEFLEGRMPEFRAFRRCVRRLHLEPIRRGLEAIAASLAGDVEETHRVDDSTVDPSSHLLI